MTELNESEIRKMPFFVTWHTMFLSIFICMGMIIKNLLYLWGEWDGIISHW
jgi:hypothetical protein